MPIYEYECNVCGHRMEAFQSMSEAALTDCPECNKSGLQKLVSAAGFQLKGTGWYATDFRDKNKAPSSATEEIKPTTTDTTKSESGAVTPPSSTDTKAD